MGHDTQLFLSQPVDDNLLCGLCLDVFDKPTTACTEGHTFCAECLASIHPPPRCPTCRSALLSPAALNRPLQNMIGNLRVCCKYHDGGSSAPPSRRQRTRADGGEKQPRGCAWRGKVEELAGHLTTCAFAEVACKLGCGASVTQGQLDSHLAACPHRVVECSLCSASLQARKLDAHKMDCPEEMTRCSYCDEPMLRKELGGLSNWARWMQQRGARGLMGHHTPAHEAKLTLHYAECPKFRLGCPTPGCSKTYLREGAADHHAQNVHEHGKLAAARIAELEADARVAIDWEPIEITWRIPTARLAGERRLQLKSVCVPVAGKEIYLRLDATTSAAPIKVSVCAEAPSWSPVRIKNLSIMVTVSEVLAHDGAVFEEAEVKSLEGEQDTSFGGELMCTRQGVRIEYEGEGEDDEPEYEYVDVPASRADLRTAADAEENVKIEASFQVRKSNNVKVACR